MADGVPLGMTSRTKNPTVYREDADASDALVEAVGKASEALECVERARGHLYSFHQLMGRADAKFQEAAAAFAGLGDGESAEMLTREVVGRNVLDGRWTFQIVDEFDDLYYDTVRPLIRSLDDQHTSGHRHVYEARLKERGRTSGHDGHEHRPPAAFDARIETDPGGK